MISGPDDIAFVEAPPKEGKLKRSNTAPKKPEGGGGLMGLFGSLRRNTRPEIPERRKSRSYRDEDGKRVDLEREESRRLRREERKRRSMRPDTDGEGFTTDPGPAAAPDMEAEDPEAKNAARKARRASRHAPADELRESELREAEERRTRRKEKERAREMREKQAREEEEDRRREEKRARRAAREERRAREEQEAKEAEARAAARRERRRLREQETYEASKARRRHSRAGEQAFEPADEGEKSKRRRSKILPEATRAPPMMSGNKHEKISSWVHSQADDPPEPPPVTPTVLDVPPPAGEPLNTHSVSSDDEARRDLRRRARRRAKYPGLTDEEIDDLRARRRRGERDGIKSSSGSGEYDRDRGYAPPLGPKVPNWFKKLTRV